MAGKRQHILPRFLLKGFASRLENDRPSAWVYRKNKPPFETSIENISVEKYFYGKTGELSADDEITDLESGYAHLIETMRQHTPGRTVSDPRIAAFIAHLSIRSKHLRESFRESTEYLVDRLCEYLSDFENAKKLILNNPKMAKQELTKVLVNVPAPEWQKGMLLELMDVWALALMTEHKSELEAVVRGLFAEVKPNLPRAIREGHIKSLARHPAPQTRADGYRHLNWFVTETDDPLILGDIGCLFETAGKRTFKPIDDMADEIVNVFLPITSRRLIIGTRFSSLPQINEKSLKRTTAKCSYDYFVSSESPPEIRYLSKSIGEWSGILSEKELGQLLTDIISDIDSGRLA